MSPENDPSHDPALEDSSNTDQQSEQREPTGTEPVTVERYQGLQRVLDKRDKEVATLKANLGNAFAQLEELRATQGTTQRSHEEAAAALKAAQEQLASSQAERDKLQKQVALQNIVLTEFPELAPVAEFIPLADTDDAFRANAVKFQTAVKNLTDRKVQETLSGGTPPPPAGTDNKPTSARIETAYKKVVDLAGIPGKEKEYESAMEEWLALNAPAKS